MNFLKSPKNKMFFYEKSFFYLIKKLFFYYESAHRKRRTFQSKIFFVLNYKHNTTLTFLVQYYKIHLYKKSYV